MTSPASSGAASATKGPSGLADLPTPMHSSRVCLSRAAESTLNSPPTRCISGAQPERAHVKLIYTRHARPTPSRPPPSAPQALMLFTKHENKFSVLLIIRRGARYMCSDGMKENDVQSVAATT